MPASNLAHLFYAPWDLRCGERAVYLAGSGSRFAPPVRDVRANDRLRIVLRGDDPEESHVRDGAVGVMVSIIVAASNPNVGQTLAQALSRVH
jgi:hypothetical protein